MIKDNKNKPDIKDLPPKKRKLRNNNLFRLFLALVILCACAGLGAGIAILEDKSDPTEYVAEYFGKFLIQDFEGMYEYVDRENVCIPKNAFVNLMTELRMKNDIGEYEFEEVVKKDGRYLVQVKYKDAETEEKKELNIYLVKYRESIKQIVADWKISIDEYMVDDVTIRIPEGMKLELDGELVDESSAAIERNDSNLVHTSADETIMIQKKDNEEVSTDNIVYRFRKILKGTHQMRALTDYTQIVQQAEFTEKAQHIVLDSANVVISDRYTQLIEKKTPEMIQEFYEVVRKRKSSSKKLLTYFVSDEKVVNSIKKLAKESQEIVYWPDTKNIENYNMIECNFSDLKYTAKYAGDQKFKVTYTFSYDYVASTDTELYNSYVYIISGKCDTTMELTYSIVEDEIKISGISMKNKNKKEEKEE